MGGKCESCNAEIKAHEGVILSDKGKSRDLCDRCFNDTIAAGYGMKFHHPEFQPLAMRDARGKIRQFRFRTLFVPTGLQIQAIEEKKGDKSGYELSVLVEPESDPMMGFKELYEKMRKALSRMHLVKDEQGYHIGEDHTVRARIEHDPDSRSGRTPIVVIDGKVFTWTQFGKLVMTYEGWSFKMKMMSGCEDE